MYITILCIKKTFISYCIISIYDKNFYLRINNKNIHYSKTKYQGNKILLRYPVILFHYILYCRGTFNIAKSPDNVVKLTELIGYI